MYTNFGQWGSQGQGFHLAPVVPPVITRTETPVDDKGGVYVTFSRNNSKIDVTDLVKASESMDFFKVNEGSPDDEYIKAHVSDPTSWRLTHYIKNKNDLCGQCPVAALAVLRFMKEKKNVTINNLFYAVGFPEPRFALPGQPEVGDAPHILGGFYKDDLYCAIDLTARGQSMWKNIRAQVYVEPNLSDLEETLRVRYGALPNQGWRFIGQKQWDELGGSILSLYPGHYYKLRSIQGDWSK